VKLAERPGRVGESDGASGDAAGSQQSERASSPQLGPLGVSVGDTEANRHGAPGDLQGVVVTHVDASGPAHQVLRIGIVILEINRRATRSVLEYKRVLDGLEPGDVLAIYYFDPKLAQRGLVTVTLD
jgi:S1-C subfamily serine protease